MAAYAALVSLLQIIKQIQDHPHPPISLDEHQAQSLTEKVNFLQNFLETYNFNHGAGGGESEVLESRIAEAAHAAEDIIESKVVDRILAAASTAHGGDEFRSDLQKVIEGMDLVKKDAMRIKEKMKFQRNPTVDYVGSSRSASTWQRGSMVGFDGVLYEVMDKLTGGKSDRQIIPIVGMAGIGKTTLARSAYESQVIVEHFDIRAWVTVSQEYKKVDILLELLQEGGGGGDSSQIDEFKVGEKLRKKLWGRRYLIILDDIWSVHVWDQLEFYFPDNSNGSRIMITTRLSNLASKVANDDGIEMQFLDEDNSWDLFCKIVFDEEGCPLELEEIGRKIIWSCKGLPLSINVIGGLLAKSARTQESWEYIGDNLNSIVNLEDNEHCLQVLYLSYYNLPVYLKPCFLYMGAFPEDFEIYVSKLIKVWIAEGFLKPIDGKTWEEIAQEFLGELIDRNLILVEKCNYIGKLKSCKIHDLLRDLCLREARKQKFLCVFGVESPNISQDLNTSTERRLSILSSSYMAEWPPELVHALESSSLARSLIWEYMQPDLPASSFRLLRVRYPIVAFSNKHHLQVIFQKVNLRFIDGGFDYYIPAFPSTFSLLWNLQTLIFSHSKIVSIPSEIWKMHQIRHVKIWSPLDLPDPAMDDGVLENLQTLAFINKFKCNNEVVKRIPNIKELAIAYWGVDDDEGSSCRYHLNNLARLHKLESLWLGMQRDPAPKNIQRRLAKDLVFPLSLKKLTLQWTRLDWEDVTEIIGSLPLLQVLKLQKEAAVGAEWETNEGQFPKLKLLEIDGSDLEYWTSESSHFPCLEHLVFGFLKYLMEIPSSIGDVSTLKSIEVEDTCSRTTIESARSIEVEQEELGNEDLTVRIFPVGRRWRRGDMRMIYGGLV